MWSYIGYFALSLFGLVAVFAMYEDFLQKVHLRAMQKLLTPDYRDCNDDLSLAKILLCLPFDIWHKDYHFDHCRIVYSRTRNGEKLEIIDLYEDRIMMCLRMVPGFPYPIRNWYMLSGEKHEEVRRILVEHCRAISRKKKNDGSGRIIFTNSEG